MRIRDHVFISDVDWDDDRNLSAHHIVRHLMRRGDRVFYVDSIGGFRRLATRDFGRAISKALATVWHPAPRRTADAPRPVVIQPLAIPDPTAAIHFPWLNGLLLRAAINRCLHDQDARNPVIWTRIASAQVHWAVSRIAHAALVYYVTGEERMSPFLTTAIRSHIDHWDADFSNRADAVFLSAHGLASRRSSSSGRLAIFPNGVDCDRMRRTNVRGRELAGVSAPVAGFVGTIDRRIDADLIVKTAALLPGWTFVLAGPVTDGRIRSKLQSMANIRLVGSIPHDRLPEIASHFDCGLIPYVINAFAFGTFPCKFAEYAALGLPVVTTPLPELAPYAESVSIVHNADEAAKAIARCQLPPSPTTSARLRAIADSLSWANMTDQMRAIIESVAHPGRTVH